jgi:hypothetical protein
MFSKNLNVKSYTFNENTFFAEYHLNYPMSEQLSRAKKSFADSRGESISIFLDHLQNIKIDYSGALTVFSDLNTGEVLKEFCYGVESSIVNYSAGLHEFRTSLKQEFCYENAAACLPGGGYNLHHFLFEILPVLLSFKSELQNYDAVILGSTPGATFLSEMNQILGLTEKLILTPINSSIKIKKLANITAVPFRIYPIDMIHEIRGLMLDKCASTIDFAPPVVFIGRQDNDRNRRSLVNETEVLKHLESIYGDVRVIRPGITKITETVRNIRSAKILIGPTGGNLAHLIWAADLELFVEIVPSGYPGITETQELSLILGFDYLRVDSNSVQNEEWVYSDQECRLESLRELPLFKPSP